MTTDYLAPTNQLLTLGVGKILRESERWPNYPKQFGLTANDIPELIRLATDSALNAGDPDNARTWAPVYAWRALGQLQAEAAIEPLLQLFELEDDGVLEEIPHVYGLIGPAAIAPLQRHLSDRHQSRLSRLVACDALVQIGRRHEAAYHDCVGAIADQVRHYRTQNPEFNGILVASLVDLGAIEIAPLIEAAFAAKRVDPAISGDWHDVQASLGLIPYSELQRRRMEAANQPIVDFSKGTGLSKSGGQGFGNTPERKSKKKKK